jgi:hypothetical protein
MSDTATPQLTQASKAVVRFRTREFDAFAEPLGYDSNVKKARLVGCGIATMSRIRAGKQNPGPAFTAKVYAAASRHGRDGAAFFDFHGTGA